jgi:hypothetical protein
VRVGERGFVPLYGNLMTGETSAGQKLVRLNLSNPDALTPQGEADFSSLDLHSYEGMASLPLPFDVVHHQGALYVALNNLSAEYQVAGPGAIAKVDPQTLSTSVLFLGEECTNVVSLNSNGEVLVAACSGSYATGTGKGLALMEGDELKALWQAPPHFSPGVMAGKCDMLWVANANGGDVYAFSTQGQNLKLLRGEGGSEGAGIEACPMPEDPSSGFVTVMSRWLKP